MGVTTRLIPLDEAAAEAWLAGDPCAFRTRDGTAEAFGHVRAALPRWREPLHLMMYDVFARHQPRPVPFWMRPWRRSPAVPPRLPWDPLVHLWGQPLPLPGTDDAAIAAKIGELLVSPHASAVWESLAAQMDSLSARAGELVRSAAREEVGTVPPVDADPSRVRPENAGEAWTALVRESAAVVPWWTVDGWLLDEWLGAAGIQVEPGPPVDLFAAVDGSESGLTGLPTRTGASGQAGVFLTSGQVHALAGSLRLRPAVIARNCAQTDDPVAAAQAGRLIAQAVLFCDARGLGLAEFVP